MNIIEATKQALEGNHFITRSSSMMCYKLKPTNDNSAGYVSISRAHRLSSHWPRWNPNADDILADDWILADDLEWDD